MVSKANSECAPCSISLFLTVSYDAGFGLSHTDEDFWNRDLGNCLDYTNHPETNMHPDSSNYQLLAELYGEVAGANESSATTSQEALPESRRTREIPEAVLTKMRMLERELRHPSHLRQSRAGWRLLHESLAGEILEVGLHDGFVLRASFLISD